jgi:hypothetical protein
MTMLSTDPIGEKVERLGRGVRQRADRRREPTSNLKAHRAILDVLGERLGKPKP